VQSAAKRAASSIFSIFKAGVKKEILKPKFEKGGFVADRV
jgi:hypothetical protein